jgi:integrase
MARKKTQYVGVYLRCAQNPKNRMGLNGKPDKCFDILYKKNGKYIWEKIGWISEGYTVQDAIEIRGQRVKSLRHPELEPPVCKSITLDEAWEAYRTRWLGSSREKKVSYLYQKYWGSNFGYRSITSITSKEVDDLSQKLLKQIKPGTVKNILSTLSRIFNKCQEWEIIPKDTHNPVKIPKILKIESPRERFLTYDEASIILNALQHVNLQVYMISKISLHTGMRLGEILNLQIQHINLETGNIDIENGKTGRRTAYISEELKKCMIKFIENKEANNIASNYLFTNENGNKLSTNYVSEVLRVTVRKLGFNKNVTSDLYKIVFHTLRHTFCSWLAIQGVSLYTISKLVGHRSPTMTQRYSKLTPDSKRDALKYIDNRILENQAVLTIGESREIPVKENNKFAKNLFTVLQHLKRAEKNGHVPLLPEDWWTSVKSSYKELDNGVFD